MFLSYETTLISVERKVIIEKGKRHVQIYLVGQGRACDQNGSDSNPSKLSGNGMKVETQRVHTAHMQYEQRKSSFLKI